MMRTPAFDREKLKAVVLRVCSKCDPENLGAVKLHKVLYFADMLRYANIGDGITGATYRKRPRGPTCEELLSVLSELERTGELEIRTVSYFGYLKKEFVPKGCISTNRLSEDELALVDEVTDFVCNSNSAKTISEFSHNRAWEMVDFGDVIEYKSVFQIFPIDVSEPARQWAYEEVRRLEAERRAGPSMGGKILGELREFVLRGTSRARAVLGTS